MPRQLPERARIQPHQLRESWSFWHNDHLHEAYEMSERKGVLEGARTVDLAEVATAAQTYA